MIIKRAFLFAFIIILSSFSSTEKEEQFIHIEFTIDGKKINTINQCSIIYHIKDSNIVSLPVDNIFTIPLDLVSNGKLSLSYIYKDKILRFDSVSIDTNECFDRWKIFIDNKPFDNYYLPKETKIDEAQLVYGLEYYTGNTYLRLQDKKSNIKYKK